MRITYRGYDFLFIFVLSSLLLVTIMLFIATISTGSYYDRNIEDFIIPSSNGEYFRYVFLIFQTIIAIISSAIGLILVIDKKVRMELMIYLSNVLKRNKE